MFVLSSDEDIVKKVTLFYSAVTSLILTCLIAVLLITHSYLNLGNRRIYLIFLFLIVFEVLKWCFYMIIYKKDYGVHRKNIFRALYELLNGADIFRSVIILFICCIGYYIIAVLFGAQLFDKIEETLMFSILITLLTTFPISVQFGSVHIELFIQQVPSSNMFVSLLHRNAQFTLIGAWFGAFVIPLDWDRPWQVWPIPCSLGALFGYSISNYLIFFQLVITHFKTWNKKFV